MTRDLTCAQAREALSAELDGEADASSDASVQAHLRGCAPCSVWQEQSRDLTRRLRLRPAEPVPDLVEPVTATARTGAGRTGGGGGPWPVERALLVVLGLVQLALSALPLLLGGAALDGRHVAHELGVTDIALAVGVLAAAWQPWRAAGMLPVVVVLAVGLAVTSALDIVAGRVGPGAEAPHLLALTDALLLVLLRRRVPSPPQDRASGSDRARTARLQLVPGHARRSA